MKYIITERQLKLIKEETDISKFIESIKSSVNLSFPYYMVNDDFERALKFANGRPFIIEGDLDLRNYDIKTLGSLVGVEGNLDLRNNKIIEDLGNLQYVRDILNLLNSSIKTLGNLQYVGRDLYLSDSEKIEDLGNLESVGGDLNLYGSKIKSLRNLKSVGGILFLAKTNIKSLRNLQSVGEHLYMHMTPLSKTTTREEIRNQVKVGGDIYF